MEQTQMNNYVPYNAPSTLFHYDSSSSNRTVLCEIASLFANRQEISAIQKSVSQSRIPWTRKIIGYKFDMSENIAKCRNISCSNSP